MNRTTIEFPDLRGDPYPQNQNSFGAPTYGAAANQSPSDPNDWQWFLPAGLPTEVNYSLPLGMQRLELISDHESDFGPSMEEIAFNECMEPDCDVPMQMFHQLSGGDY